MRDLPHSDEIEITVLGKSFGESVVAHLGSGNWIVVDSLLDDGGIAAPLAYLKSIGVDVSSSIKLIALTHWHRDHIGGISQIMEAAPSASVALPAAFSNTNFSTFTEACLSDRSIRTDELKEISRVGELFSDGTRPAPTYTSGARPLITIPASSSSSGVAVTLYGLSPSDRDVHQFYLRLSGHSPGSGVARLPAFKENDISIAMWLSIGDDAVLLGADLETVGANDRGWKAVLGSTTRPEGRASLYKVAHHGSSTGHHADIWPKLLSSEATSVVAPWNRSTGLPTDADKRRILALSPNSFITAQVAARRYQPKGVEVKTLASHGITVVDTNHRVGAVRLRKSLSSRLGRWEVDLQNGAVHLKDFVAKK